MSDESQRPIVVKRIKKKAHGHHGGAWKIAYADFVTAMMAFFLLMWLLGSTVKGDLQGIAEYFRTPLKVALQGGSGSGDSSSLIKAGGKDVTRRNGQIKRGEISEARRSVNLKAAHAEKQPKKDIATNPKEINAVKSNRQEKKQEEKEGEAELTKKEAAKLRELKTKLESAISANEMLRQFKNQLLLDITAEGLRIQIVDENKRPMFTVGSAQVQPYTKEILREIGKVLNEVPNRISLTGHTDATPYSGGEKGYSNWELSTDRSNAARRELVAGGMDEKRILRVVGLSSAVLFDEKDPYNPINRRISIIVMNRKAEQAIKKEINGNDPGQAAANQARISDPVKMRASDAKS